MALKRDKQENAPRASEISEHKRADEMAQGEMEQALSIANKIAEIFLTVPDSEMYGDVLELVLKATKSKYGVFGYITDNSDLVIPSLTRNVWDQCKMLKKKIVYPRDTWGGIWGRALVEQKTLYTNEPLDVPEGHVPILKVLVVPIIHRGAAIGHFQVANKTADYDEVDIRFLESIANHTAPILHARLQRDKEERERKRTEKELKASLRKLKESEEKLQLVGRLTRHDAGNKLFIINGFAQIAIQNTKDEVLLGYLKQIVDAVEIAQNVLALSKKYQELGVEEPQWREMRASCDIGRFNINLNSITLINDLEGLEIFTDSLIEQVFYNLVDNTIRHGGGEVTEIRVFYDEFEKGLKLIYVDDGVGVPESEKEIIFERGYGANTGYGLDLIRKTLEISRMDIKETGEPGKGVRFEISVPKDRYRILEQE